MMDRQELEIKVKESFELIKPFMFSLSNRKLELEKDGKDMMAKCCAVKMYFHELFDEIILYKQGTVTNKLTEEQLSAILKKIETVLYFINRPVEYFDDINGFLKFKHDEGYTEFDSTAEITITTDFSWLQKCSFE